MFALGNPITQQGRLAEPGRRGDERQWPQDIQLFDQAWTGNAVQARRLDIKLGGKQGSQHQLPVNKFLFIFILFQDT